MNTSDELISRRELIAATVALPVLFGLPGGCASFNDPPTRRVDFADAHIHLFNAHDLPVGAFLVEVVFRERNLPRALKAVIDIIARRIQPIAISAERERRHLEGEGLLDESAAAWTPERFGAEIGAWARNPDGTAAFGLLDAEELRSAYEELVALVLADADFEPGDAFLNAAVGRDQAIEAAFGRLARRAEPTAGPAPGDSLVEEPLAPESNGLCPELPCPKRPPSMSLRAILRYLGWGYLMLKSREAHLLDYIRFSHENGEAPRLLVNHLVDYDRWLGEERRSGSSHADQVEVAHALAKIYAAPGPNQPAVDLRNFAGFCPLKHALERRQLGRPVTFETQLAQLRDGKIAGFKLYPPMGFRPWNNAALPNSDFDPQSSYRAEHFRRWSAALGATPGGKEIGEALDASLDAFYSECARLRIPLMAHAGPGQEAGPAFGQRANPLHWYAVAKKYPLRLSLGHLVNSAEDFVCALQARGDPPACVWALGTSRLLLDPTHSLQATVYGDLGFMPELIAKPDLAVAFFIGLKALYGRQDPKLTRILYGSDYIMIGNMPDYDRHLRSIRTAMTYAEYDSEMIENILFANARRLLNTS